LNQVQHDSKYPSLSFRIKAPEPRKKELQRTPVKKKTQAGNLIPCKFEIQNRISKTTPKKKKPHVKINAKEFCVILEVCMTQEFIIPS